MTEEGKIQEQICHLLTTLGYLVIRFNSGIFKIGQRFIRAYIIKNNGMSKGLPDVAFMKNGKIKFIEVKQGRNKMTESQKDFKNLAYRYGIDVHTFYSWVECYEFIKNYKG